MRTYEFIFSNKVKHRLSRHVIFWLFFLIYFYYVNLIPSKAEDLLDSKTYSDALKLMIYWPVSIISVYVAIDFLLPKYILKEKYLQVILIFIGLTIIYFFVALLLTILLARLTTNVPFNQLPISFRWFQPVRYGIGLPLTSAVLTTIIKLFKTWQREEKESELLQRKKILTEMQLLKTHFQPHLFYNSLQQLYPLIQKHAPQSPQAVLHLSDLLSYVLYENEKEKVPLENELEIVKTYLGLKNILYPDKLSFDIKHSNDLTAVTIAPFIMLSLVESCVETRLPHSAYKLLLSMEVKIQADEIDCYITCKSNIKNTFNKNFMNLQWQKSLKRIELLYPGKHHLHMDNIEGKTTVHLLLNHTSEHAVTAENTNEKSVLS